MKQYVPRQEHIAGELMAEGFGEPELPVYMTDIYLGPDDSPEAIELARQHAEDDARRLPLLDVGSRQPEPVVDALADEFWVGYERERNIETGNQIATGLFARSLPWARNYPKFGSTEKSDIPAKRPNLSREDMAELFAVAEAVHGLNGGNKYRYNKKRDTEEAWTRHDADALGEYAQEHFAVMATLNQEELPYTPAADDSRPSNSKWAYEPDAKSWPYNIFPTDEEAYDAWFAQQAGKVRVRERRENAELDKKKPMSQAEFESEILAAIASTWKYLRQMIYPDELRAPATIVREKPYAKSFATKPDPSVDVAANEVIAQHNALQSQLRRMQK